MINTARRRKALKETIITEFNKYKIKFNMVKITASLVIHVTLIDYKVPCYIIQDIVDNVLNNAGYEDNEYSINLHL